MNLFLTCALILLTLGLEADPAEQGSTPPAKGGTFVMPEGEEGNAPKDDSDFPLVMDEGSVDTDEKDEYADDDSEPDKEESRTAS